MQFQDPGLNTLGLTEPYFILYKGHYVVMKVRHGSKTSHCGHILFYSAKNAETTWRGKTISSTVPSTTSLTSYATERLFYVPVLLTFINVSTDTETPRL